MRGGKVKEMVKMINGWRKKEGQGEVAGLGTCLKSNKNEENCGRWR